MDSKPSDSNGELLNRVQQLRLDPHLGREAGGRGIAWLPWSLLVVMALAWAGMGIRGYRDEATNKKNTAPIPPETETKQAGGKLLDLKGYLVPARQIAVSPIDVAGRVVELNIVEGKKFNKGDILAKIEDTNFLAQVEEGRATVAAAHKRLEGAKARFASMLPASVRTIEITQLEQELNEAEAQKDQAKDEVERLLRLSVGTAAEREMIQAKFILLAAEARVSRLMASLAILKEGPRQEMKDAAQAEIKSAEADIQAAEARLRQAEWRLENCIIRAPITGTVLTKKAELYNLVNPLAFAATSGSICDMADLSDLEVEVEIPERDLSKLAAVKSCKVRADAYPEREYEGRLDRIMPIAVRGKSIVYVRVKVQLQPGEEPGTYLKPEMGVVVSFRSE